MALYGLTLTPDAWPSQVNFLEATIVHRQTNLKRKIVLIKLSTLPFPSSFKTVSSVVDWMTDFDGTVSINVRVCLLNGIRNNSFKC